jgi:hypothetical protein
MALNTKAFSTLDSRPVGPTSLVLHKDSTGFARGAAQSPPRVVSSNTQAGLNEVLHVVANATITDPASPTEGAGFTVLVRNGTATVGGTAYNIAGTVIDRIWHSGSYTNYVRFSSPISPLEVRTSGFTAAIGGRYIARGTFTVTDPSGTTAGQEYSVVIGSGSVTIGGVAFAASRFPVIRQYNGSAWETLAQVINGAVTIGGNLTVQGNTVLGDASGDTLTITSQTVTASNANGTAAGSIANVGTLDARYGRLASRPLGLAYNSNASWATYADGPAHGEGTVAFAGGVLIPDGQVVLVPTGTEIGLYNPATGNYTAGPTHGEAGIGFTGGVLLPDGNVVLVPFNSANVGIYNPSTGNYTAGVAHGRGANAWVGGVLLPDGRVLFVPTGSGVDIGLYDPVANTFAVGPGANGLAGGVLLPNGRVLLVPITNSNIRIFNPADNTLATGPAATGYYGGVLLPDGRVMLVPWTAANIGLYDPVANTFTSGPAHGQGANAFVGGVALPNGRVLLVPRESTVVGFYDPISNTYKNGPTHGAGAAAFSGGVLLPDGRVLLVPRNAANLGLVDSFQPAPGRILGPFYNKF